MNPHILVTCLAMLTLVLSGACDGDSAPQGPVAPNPDGTVSGDGASMSDGTAPDGSSPSSPTAQLNAPPESTKGFTECGTIDGKTNWCQPGMHCDATQVEPCDEECNSNSACPTGTSCVKPDTAGALNKVCLPTSESNPKTASGDGAGVSYCGYKSDGSVFTCSPGSYCNDPVANRCSEGCLSYINCGEGEYCDYFHEDATFWKGVCAQGKGGGPTDPPKTGDGCATGDQFCCCVNGAYHMCPTEQAFFQCSGGDLFSCLDACSFDDFACQNACYEAQGNGDPSSCERQEAKDGSCADL